MTGGAQCLPFLERIQHSFGYYDVSDVEAHLGPGATAASQAIGAEAYTFGGEIAFGAMPSLHTAAHEAAHVIQQRAGIRLKDDVGQIGDRHELHADKVAEAVVQGRSATALLDRYGLKASGWNSAVPHGAIQQKKASTSMGGTPVQLPDDAQLEIDYKAEIDYYDSKADADETALVDRINQKVFGPINQRRRKKVEGYYQDYLDSGKRDRQWLFEDPEVAKFAGGRGPYAGKFSQTSGYSRQVAGGPPKAGSIWAYDSPTVLTANVTLPSGRVVPKGTDLTHDYLKTNFPSKIPGKTTLPKGPPPMVNNPDRTALDELLANASPPDVVRASTTPESAMRSIATMPASTAPLASQESEAEKLGQIAGYSEFKDTKKQSLWVVELGFPARPALDRHRIWGKNVEIIKPGVAERRGGMKGVHTERVNNYMFGEGTPPTSSGTMTEVFGVQQGERKKGGIEFLKSAADPNAAKIAWIFSAIAFDPPTKDMQFDTMSKRTEVIINKKTAALEAVRKYFADRKTFIAKYQAQLPE